MGQIPESKVCGTVEQYFRMNRLCPELIDVDVFDHPTEGHTMRIKIIARRSQSQKDIGLAFSAAAAVANCAGQDFELFWVEMGINYKGTETTHFFAEADCTIDALILQTRPAATWWDDCVQVQ